MGNPQIDRKSYTVLMGQEIGHNHSGKQLGNLVKLNFITAISLMGMSQIETLTGCEPGDTSRNVHSIICNNQKEREKPNTKHSEEWINMLRSNPPINSSRLYN